MSDPFTSPPSGAARRSAARKVAEPVPVPEPVPSPRVPDRSEMRPAEPAPAPREPERVAAPQEIPQDFVYDAEHPVLPVPFTVQIADTKLEGTGLSVAAAYVAITGTLDPAWKGRKEIAKLQFDFQGFSVTMFPEVVVAGSREDGEMTLQFMDPAGPHLPQLRYILNSYIAGDYVAMGGLLSYSGPTSPKAGKANGTKPSRFRIRSVAVAFLSACLIIASAKILLTRVTQSYELRPVFIERVGKDMKATTAGQIGFLNPAAKAGEVVFSINSNAGDVLNFKLPCDCEVSVTDGIFEGATVLPIDSILSFFEPTFGIKVQTQMSIEGLAKAVNGERAFLDVNDGRTIPVRVVMTSATNAAALRGDPFVPVNLVPMEDVLTKDDVGKAAQLRLARPWFRSLSAKPAE